VILLYKKPQYRFKTYKSDAAPFFFYIDIYPFDTTQFEFSYLKSLIKTIEKNPIVPLPMRVDRVFNGQSSIIIRPQEVISFQISEEQTAVINPHQFLYYGVKNLIYFTEIRSSQRLSKLTSRDKVNSWWEKTKFLYGNLNRLEEDFSAFLKAYLLTMVKTYVEEDDLISAAIQYCQILEEICKKRMDQNKILIDINSETSIVRMYKKKEVSYYKKFKKVSEVQYHPELIDIEVFDYSENGWPANITNMYPLDRYEKMYIPLLFYDDLQECMLLNLKYLEENEKFLLNPSRLIENKVISIVNSKNNAGNFKGGNSWWQDFNNIKPYVFLEEMVQYHLKS
jgi:hypothetical protein